MRPCTNTDRDGLSQRTAGAGQTAAGHRDLPTYHPAASSSSYYRRASHPHIQQQQHNMTLVHFEASAPPAWSSNAASQEQQLPHGSASIPRSALEGLQSTVRGHIGSAKLRKSHSLHNLNIDLSSVAQPSLSVDSKQPRSISQLYLHS